MKNLWKKLWGWFIEEYKFKFVCGCEHVGIQSCSELSESVFPVICTRKAGHEGDHVACAITEHRVKVWRK